MKIFFQFEIMFTKFTNIYSGLSYLILVDRIIDCEKKNFAN